MLKYMGRADLELHASPIRSGKGIWRSILKENRESILKGCLDYVKNNYPRQFILFGAVINNSTENVPENLFTQITSRFDKFLKRKYLKNKETARGLAVFDKSKMEMFTTHLAMAVQRIMVSGAVEQLDDAIWNEVQAFDTFGEAKQVYSNITSDIPVQIPESEEKFLLMHLCNLLQEEC